MSPPKPVEVRCQVCGNEWRTITEYPQCHNPEGTETDCGRSRLWEYVNPEDDPDYDKDNETENTDSDGSDSDGRISEGSSDDMEGNSDANKGDIDGDNDTPIGSDESGASDGADSEQLNDTGSVEVDERVSDSGNSEPMVTQKEYDSFHGETSSNTDSKPTGVSNQSSKKSDTGRSKGSIGLPVDRKVLVIGAVALIGLAALYFFVLKPRSKSENSPEPSTETIEPEESDGDSDESIKSDDDQGITVEESTQEETKSNPVDSARKYQPRRSDDIPLLEG